MADVQAFFLKTFSAELATVVCNIFNDTIANSQLPVPWCTMQVSPIPKSPHPSSADELRPISKFPILCRILEKQIARIVTQKASPHIFPTQFGGISGRSTTLYLISLLDQLSRITDLSGLLAILLALDIKKAFNSCSHLLIIEALKAIQLDIHLTNWIFFFLSHLRQTVFFNCKQSTTTISLHCGVPQGSSLGTPLFNLVINSCLQTISSNHKFIDDLAAIAYTSNINPDYSTAQNILNEADRWCAEHHFQLNPNKCEVMFINFSIHPPPPPPTLHVANSSLTPSPAIKLLGVYIQQDLKWDITIDKAIAKANQRLFGLRTLARTGLDHTMLKTFYTTYIRPILEYCSPVWAGAITKQQSYNLERVQRRACATIKRDWTSPYLLVLQELELETLESRRDSSVLRMGREVKQNPTYCHLLPHTRLEDTGIHTKSASLLNIPYCRTERRKKSPIPHMVRLMNSLSLQ